MPEFTHDWLKRPLSFTETLELGNALLRFSLEQPDPHKPFTGAESPGHDTHAKRGIKAAKR